MSENYMTIFTSLSNTGCLMQWYADILFAVPSESFRAGDKLCFAIDTEEGLTAICWMWSEGHSCYWTIYADDLGQRIRDGNRSIWLLVKST